MYSTSRLSTPGDTTRATTPLSPSSRNVNPVAEADVQKMKEPTKISGYKVTPEQFLSSLKELIFNAHDGAILNIFKDEPEVAEPLIKAINENKPRMEQIIQHGVEGPVGNDTMTDR